jgi:hypothetical protein
LDGEANVRGGYCIKHQVYRIAGEEKSIGQIALPLSEGVIDRGYSQVGAQLLLHAIHRQPLMYALGMGGYGEPITHLVRAARWRVITVPFQFRIVRPAAFLRNIQLLRRSRFSRPTRMLLDVLACSGLGWLGCQGASLLFAQSPPLLPGLEAEEVDEFADWADDLWVSCASQYPYAAVRDMATLRILYPKENHRFIRLKVSQSGRLLGWAVLLVTNLVKHKQFGNMRLGSIVDVLAPPAEAEKIIAAAERLLRERKVDLMVSNQSHGSWQRALRRCGFLRGPSNFLFATSRKLTELLKASQVPNDQLHLNRGDGDGPINL